MNYIDVVRASNGLAGGVGLEVEGMESNAEQAERRVRATCFDYVARSYRAYMAGDDQQCAEIDEEMIGGFREEEARTAEQIDAKKQVGPPHPHTFEDELMSIVVTPEGIHHSKWDMKEHAQQDYGLRRHALRVWWLSSLQISLKSDATAADAVPFCFSTSLAPRAPTALWFFNNMLVCPQETAPRYSLPGIGDSVGPGIQNKMGYVCFGKQKRHQLLFHILPVHLPVELSEPWGWESDHLILLQFHAAAGVFGTTVNSI